MNVLSVLAKSYWKTELNFSHFVLFVMKNRFSLRYFVSYCSLVLIYVLKFYRTKLISILLRRHMFTLLPTIFWGGNHVLSQLLRGFSVENLETTPNTFPLKLQSNIFLSQVINWVGIYTLYTNLRRP